MLLRIHKEHDSNVEEVEYDASKGTPEANNISTSNAFAKENAVVVAVFNAYVTVIAVVQINLAQVEFADLTIVPLAVVLHCWWHVALLHLGFAIISLCACGRFNVLHLNSFTLSLLFFQETIDKLLWNAWVLQDAHKKKR